jgi:hypothetical protein
VDLTKQYLNLEHPRKLVKAARLAHYSQQRLVMDEKRDIVVKEKAKN